MERVAKMEKEHQRKVEEEEFERKRLQNIAEFESRVQKKAKRRRLRKDRAKNRQVKQSVPDDSTKQHDDQLTNVIDEQNCKKTIKQNGTAEDELHLTSKDDPSSVEIIELDSTLVP